MRAKNLDPKRVHDVTSDIEWRKESNTIIQRQTRKPGSQDKALEQLYQDQVYRWKIAAGFSPGSDRDRKQSITPFIH